MDEILDLGAETEVSELETEVEGTEAESGAEGAEGTAELQSTEPVSAATTWKQVKDRLKDSPELHRKVKEALHLADDVYKRFPDGVTKTAERLQLLSQLDDNPEDPEYVAGSTPIEQVISNTIAERGFWRDFDNAFQQGDAKVVNQMIEANPGSFQKLIPAAMDKYAELNPDGFSSYICKSVSSFLNEAEIPLQLKLLDRVLPASSEDPGLQTVIDAFKAIRGVVSQIDLTAKKPIEVKGGQTAQATQGTGNDLESREQNILHNEWLQEIRPRSESFAVSEVQRIAPKTRFTPAEVSTIKNAVRQEINARVAVDQGYQQKVKSLLRAKNKAAYAMTVESQHKKIIPGAVKRAVDDILAKRKAVGTKKTGRDTETVKSGAHQVGTVTTGDYERIAQSPSRLGLKVDMRKTSNEMLAGNKAYIVGRSKPVTWPGRK